MDATVWLWIGAIIAAGLGVGSFFIGCLFALIIALGNKHYVWGICGFIFLPVTVLYTLRHRNDATRFCARFQWAGIAIVALLLIPYYRFMV
ncbi:hypothetical protein [Saccharospirillum mangrovi]|uniref:hypothetical protein n=1 Tax=Saccharospirillum mangrovi TaxID=2161747 RepID=UPI000D37BD97|nr:hypothetical protein [Saccharospirillum mangrovi]